MPRFTGVGVIVRLFRLLPFEKTPTMGGALVRGLVVIFLLLPLIASARLIKYWSHEEMFDKADLVVLALPISTADTAETTKILGREAVGVSSDLDVQLVLKGSKALKSIRLHHYRAKEAGPTINGPALISFKMTQRDTYLLFLRAERDGRYAPVSGQIDPALDSVTRLDRSARSSSNGNE